MYQDVQFGEVVNKLLFNGTSRGATLYGSLVLLIASLAAFPAQALTESVSLDQFLHGVDDQCRYGESLDKFWKNLMTVDINGKPKLTELIAREYVPIEIRQAMGNAAFTEKNDEYFAINVPITGTWRGLRVEAMEFIIGNESGWHSLAVRFNSTPQQVKDIFGPIVVNSQRKMKADSNNEIEATIEFVTKNNKIMLVCDDST